jgi:hypothetical protein
MSDSEFVEKTRKWLRLSRKLFWVHWGILLLLGVIVPRLISLLWEFIKNMPDEAQKMMWTGLVLGIIFGTVVEKFLVSAVQTFMASLDLFDFNRSSRLLIQYHDKLKELGLLKDDTTG